MGPGSLRREVFLVLMRLGDELHPQTPRNLSGCVVGVEYRTERARWPEPPPPPFPTSPAPFPSPLPQGSNTTITRLGTETEALVLTVTVPGATAGHRWAPLGGPLGSATDSAPPTFLTRQDGTRRATGHAVTRAARSAAVDSRASDARPLTRVLRLIMKPPGLRAEHCLGLAGLGSARQPGQPPASPAPHQALTATTSALETLGLGN